MLLLLIALPAWAAFEHRGTPLDALDYVLTVLFIIFLAMEFIADQQQWDFHWAKRARRDRGELVEKGCLDTGLWRYPRHPNFFAEQAQWWVVYAFGVVAGAPVLNATMLGAGLLTLLFWGSRRFIEGLSAVKYPEYAEYQRITSATIPWWPKGAKQDG